MELCAVRIRVRTESRIHAKHGRKQNENVMNVIQFIKLLNGVKCYNVIKTRHLHNIYGHIHIHIFHHYNFELIFSWLHFFSTFTSLLLCQTSTKGESKMLQDFCKFAFSIFASLACSLSLFSPFFLFHSSMVAFFLHTYGSDYLGILDFMRVPL